MKKLISIFLSSIIVFFVCMVPHYAFAVCESEQSAEFTKEEFESLEHSYAVPIQTYSSDLITNHTLGIAKNNKNLLIMGSTKGSSNVVKCGFKKIVIQRRSSSSATWSNYKTLNDLYSESTYYKLSKSIPVESGYYYRVEATHYARKSLFSTQKIDVITAALSF